MPNIDADLHLGEDHLPFEDKEKDQECDPQVANGKSIEEDRLEDEVFIAVLYEPYGERCQGAHKWKEPRPSLSRASIMREEDNAENSTIDKAVEKVGH